MGPKPMKPSKRNLRKAEHSSSEGEYIDIDNQLNVPANPHHSTATKAIPSPLSSLLPSEPSDNAGSRTACDIQQLFRISEEDGYRYCKTCE